MVPPCSTRTAGDGITSARLGEIWPAASRRLLRVLELRGLDRATAEDLVQEVSVRAISSGVTFEGLDDFLWWATPVVRNLHVDLIRASKWSVAAAEVPEREAPAARVDHVVERRMALQSVLQHLSAMPEADREAIVTGATDAPVEESRRGTLAVRRHRARAHLRRVVGSALGLGGVAAFLRRLRVTGAATTPVTAVAFALPALVYGVLSDPARPVPVPSGRAHAVSLADAPDAPDPVRRSRAAAGKPAATAPRAAARAEAGGPVVRGVGHGAVLRPHEPMHLEVKPVDDRGLRADRRETEEADPLVCVWGGEVVGDHCVDRPAAPHGAVNANDPVR